MLKGDTAGDDGVVRWVSAAEALAKNSTPMAFIMPERIAKTDPFQQISQYIGSGPMRFKRDEWVPGAKSVFEKFADYQPRQEPASWLAGGKRMLVDRIEWHVMPDPATASAALQNGEADWWAARTLTSGGVLRVTPDLFAELSPPASDSVRSWRGVRRKGSVSLARPGPATFLGYILRFELAGAVTAGTGRGQVDKFMAPAVFARVIESGGFTSTARKLGLSPSAITKIIARLEDELGPHDKAAAYHRSWPGIP